MKSGLVCACFSIQILKILQIAQKFSLPPSLELKSIGWGPLQEPPVADRCLLSEGELLWFLVIHGRPEETFLLGIEAGYSYTLHLGFLPEILSPRLWLGQDNPNRVRPKETPFLHSWANTGNNGQTNMPSYIHRWYNM